MRRLAVVTAVLGADLAAVAACGSSPAQTPEVTGTLELDGSKATVLACRAGRALKPYVELVTSRGKLRFEDGALSWSADPEPLARGQQLDCARLDRAWGSGYRRDGTAYFKAWTFQFDCKPAADAAEGAPGVPAVSGDLRLACGSITADEHAELDRNRADHKRSQAGDGPP